MRSSDLPQRLVLVDSVTRLGPDARGAVVIGGSHCGVYAAYVALKAGVRGVVLNDAAVGLEQAGISGLAYLDEAAVPAAAVGYDTARIGDGADCAARGIVSHVNRTAAALGVTVGMPARRAAELLQQAPSAPHRELSLEHESRTTLVLSPAARPVLVMDSVSLVAPGDEGAVVVAGSHGGLLGGVAATAIKIDAFTAVYNDAGVGIEGAGVTRLPALEVRGIAAVTVDVWSARIGDGRSGYDTGVLTHVNKQARRLGANPGMTAREFVARAADATA